MVQVVCASEQTTFEVADILDPFIGLSSWARKRVRRSGVAMS
jgi:hypothetical protein